MSLQNLLGISLDRIEPDQVQIRKLLARRFTPEAPNRVWTSNITCIQTGEGWMHLAIVLDLFNREVIGWSIKPRMTADIVTDALTMAWFRRQLSVQGENAARIHPH